MASLGRLWAGRLYGTNTGNLAAELNSTDEGVSGVIRLMDDRFGPVVYEVKGKFEDGAFSAEASVKQAPEGTENGVVTISALLLETGSLKGEWSSTIGTGGTFELFPHDPPRRPLPAARGAPEQLHSASRTMGAIRLHRDDIQDLLNFVSADFTVARPIITYAPRGNNVTLYASDFLSQDVKVEKLRYFKIFLQEKDTAGVSVNKIVMIELSADGPNVLRVEGANESWVIGRCEAIARYLRQYERSVVTNYKKFGLGFNQMLLLAVLVAVPQFEAFALRAAFVGMALVLIAILTWVHANVIPNALVYMGAKAPSGFARAFPSILSWFIAATASFAAAFAFWLLTRS